MASTTEELEAKILAEMESNPEAYAVEENNFLLIDNDLRTISIPKGIKNLGVESDDDVHRLYFQMPKTYGEFDLSTFDIRINYKNGNIGDAYAVEDKKADGDVITFSWLVGRNAVKTKGTTQFIVCLKKSDSSGIVQQEFNTTVASLNVLKGLETTEQVIQANADIIEQILKKIDGLTSISQEDIANAVADWMIEHPPSGMTAEEKAQLQKNTEDISSLSEEKVDRANSLWNILKKTAFTEPLTDAEINEFKTAWGITEEVEPDTPTTYTITRNLTNCTSSSEVTSISGGSAHTETITANNSYTLTGATVSVTMGDLDITSSYSNGVLNISSVTGNIVLTVSAVQETTEPDNPEVTLTSISATYTGGSVAVGTELTSLTGIAVTATYSDGSTATVTDYTLSGTIADGSNTITVSYGGKTTTFTVTGVSSGGEETGISNETEWTDGVPYTFEWVKNEYVKNSDGTMIAYNGWDRTPHLYCKGATSLTTYNPSTTTQYNVFYDENKTFLSKFSVIHSASTAEIPENACYFVISYDATNLKDNETPFSITPKA